MTPTTYLSLGAFYGADARRAHSPEVELGSWWRTGTQQGPSYRAAWVRDTGEVYLMAHEGRPGGGRVDVVTARASIEELLAELDGWELVCGDEDSVVWLLERLCRPDRPSPGDPAVAFAATG
jgi:hypothetical protein